jgi:hypothetical protein
MPFFDPVRPNQPISYQLVPLLTLEGQVNTLTVSQPHQGPIFNLIPFAPLGGQINPAPSIVAQAHPGQINPSINININTGVNPAVAVAQSPAIAQAVSLAPAISQQPVTAGLNNPSNLDQALLSQDLLDIQTMVTRIANPPGRRKLSDISFEKKNDTIVLTVACRPKRGGPGSSNPGPPPPPAPPMASMTSSRSTIQLIGSVASPVNSVEQQRLLFPGIVFGVVLVVSFVTKFFFHKK